MCGVRRPAHNWEDCQESRVRAEHAPYVASILPAHTTPFMLLKPSGSRLAKGSPY